MKATTACVLLVCQSVILYWLVLTCQTEHALLPKHSLGTSVPLSDFPLRSFPDGSVGIGVLVPDAPIVVHSRNNGTELYRLHTDGTEWYAPGVDHVWMQGLLFQARCLVQAQCL
jgi:hypothetical protein